MPRPLPEYIPPLFRDYLRKRKLSLKDISQTTGIAHTTVREFFNGATQHRSLWIFQDFCQEVEVDMEVMADALELEDADRRRATIKSYIYDHWISIQEIDREGTITDTYIEQLFRGETGGKIVEVYRPLARFFKLTLKELSVALGGPPKKKKHAS